MANDTAVKATTDKPAKIVLDVDSHKDAVSLGLQLDQARDNAQAIARTMMGYGPAHLHQLLTTLDAMAFAQCENKRQLAAHDICTVAVQTLARWANAENAAQVADEAQATAENQEEALQLARATRIVANMAATSAQAELFLLATQGPTSLKNADDAASLALKGYMTIFRALRSVPVAYCSMPERRRAWDAKEAVSKAATVKAREELRARLGLNNHAVKQLIAG